MNILIVGGLLGLAVVAILGAVLLGISEDRAGKAQKAAVNANTNAPALLPQQSQSRQVVDQGPALAPVPATPVLARATGQLSARSEDERLASLNGQVSELTAELRTLAQRAGEIEQRLNNLSELLERHEARSASAPEQSGPFHSPDEDRTQPF